MKKNVFVAMSGGLDSSVCAYLLKEEGYHVTGITMKVMQEDDPAFFASDTACKDAKAMADFLGIEHVIVDFHKEFEETVVADFISEYFKGRTPNPCAVCNLKVKFGRLLEESVARGADFLATGHYAKVEEINGRFGLFKGKDESRDQSYFLYSLTQEQLKRVMFPLFELQKSQIREIAQEQNMPVANKGESREICFIENDYREFLKRKVGEDKIVPADFIDRKGNFIAKCDGIPMYTIGQRKGLGISFPQKTYVTKLDAAENKVYLGLKEDLKSQNFEVEKFNWVGMEKLEGKFECEVKIRYKHAPVKAFIEQKEENIFVTLADPQESITPGQAAVFYKEELVIGGGRIK